MRPEIIAEIGQNHNGDMEVAKSLIHAAKSHGADVAKFQLFDAEKIFTNHNDPWFAYNRQTQLNRTQVATLFEECRQAGIEFMASVFDAERLAWLEELGVCRHKIASRSIRDKELIGKLCDTGKPLIVSLGMWDQAQFPTILARGPVDFLYCVAKYPAQLDELKLSSVDFARYSGFSDHSVGVHAAMVALARGARILEKHFTLDKKAYGPDHACSMTPDELAQIDGFRQAVMSIL